MINTSGRNRPAAEGAPPMLDIRHLSETELAALGVAEIAYVKPISLQGGIAFAIHAADGTPIALADDAEVAIAAIRERGMEPVRVN